MANPEHLEILMGNVNEWNLWRRRNPAIRPDFSGASLAYAKLRMANLFNADLSNANLSSAELSVANLHNADLSNANLKLADLLRADMSKANLSAANLSAADLHDVNLTQADLSAVDLHMATCRDTIFANVDLSGVIGIDTVEHLGPSYIDIQTLIKSKGKIPEVFLRGCGVPTELVRSISTMFSDLRMQYYSCFISYSRVDIEFARRVHEALYARGIVCYRDEEDMRAGDPILEAVYNHINNSDRLLLCASQNSLTSWWVDKELTMLFDREERLYRRTGQMPHLLIAVNVDDYLLSDEWDNPKAPEIRSRIAANFQGWENDNALFDREMEKVIKALRTDAGRESPPPQKL